MTVGNVWTFTNSEAKTHVIKKAHHINKIMSISSKGMVEVSNVKAACVVNVKLAFTD